jgi:hypothetical protein
LLFIKLFGVWNLLVYSIFRLPFLVMKFAQLHRDGVLQWLILNGKHYHDHIHQPKHASGRTSTVINNRTRRNMERLRSFTSVYWCRTIMKFPLPYVEEMIPISIRMSGITIALLREGRLKVCYSCKLSGHVKSECTIFKYRVCYELGHDDPDCQNQITRRCNRNMI